MKILNLYAGIGGNRHLWGNKHEITSVEIDEDIAREYKKKFPNDTVVIGDAHQYLLDHYKEFDFIWSSPPCPTHSRLCTAMPIKKYPDMTLYQEIIFLMKWFKGFWVVENVVPYYEPLIKPSFELDRHLFWSNFKVEFKEFPRLGFYKKGTTNQSMCEFHNIPYPNCKENRKVIRNCVNPKVAKYILDNLKLTPKDIIKP